MKIHKTPGFGKWRIFMSTENNSQNSNPQNNDPLNSTFRRRSSNSSIIILLVIIVAYFLISRFTEASNITWSTVQRNKIEDTTAPTEFLTDETDGYITDEAALQEGIMTFYSRTGVLPYLYILKDDTSVASYADLNERAQELYDETFTDEDHFLIVACNNGSEFIFTYIVGDDAAVLMDTEAISIFDDCIALYADEANLTTRVSKSLDTGSTHIMQTGNMGYRNIIIIAIVVIAIGYMVWRYKKNGGKWNSDDGISDNRMKFR